MFLTKKQDILRQYLARQNGTIAYIPTMGALHDGHLSLVSLAQNYADIVVVSIFVNPTQFDNKDDLIKYPKPIEADIEKLTLAGCDVLYHPEVDDIYPEGPDTLKNYDLGYLDDVLEGQYRDGHYQGVANVVSLLLTAVEPDFLILGAKDYQQVMVIKTMMKQDGIEAEVIVAPTRREASGLAMSSRNTRLSEKQKAAAAVISEQLEYYSDRNHRDTTWNAAQKSFVTELSQAGFEPIDYVALADAEDLTLLEEFDETRKMMILVAAYMGDVRLIDNKGIN